MTGWTQAAQLLAQGVALIRNPGPLIAWGGYPALCSIIFLETGALVFFLPGDSLLVVAGFYAAQGSLNLGVLNLLLAPMAILGDACSYTLGKHFGAQLLTLPANPATTRRWLRPAHLQAAQDFYTQHGGKAIVLARFVPVVRTFVPVVAGIARMGYRRFAFYNMLGGVAWVASMTCIGYFLGARFPFLQTHLEKVILAILAISALPGLLEYWRTRRVP